MCVCVCVWIVILWYGKNIAWRCLRIGSWGRYLVESSWNVMAQKLFENRVLRKIFGKVQLKYDGTRWRTGGKLKGKLANGVGSQYPSHYHGTWCIQYYYSWWRTPRLPVVVWTDAPADLNGLVRFAERRNLVSARVPSHFKWPLHNVL